MDRVFVGIFVFLSSAFIATADVMQCEGSDVTVNSADADVAKTICDAVDGTKELFKQCNVPPVAAPLRIDVVDDIRDSCVALYHCGEGYIKVLPPTLMQQKRDDEGAFSFLPIERYFRSVIVHEVTHAAFDTVPCPISSCVVGAEYVAYAMQLMSLTPEDRQSFVDLAGLDRKVSRDELSAVILYMAPHLFSQKAWTHLLQRQDPCGYIGQITEGKIMLDHQVFE
jgi:hypothetical protein